MINRKALIPQSPTKRITKKMHKAVQRIKTRNQNPEISALEMGPGGKIPALTEYEIGMKSIDPFLISHNTSYRIRRLAARIGCAFPKDFQIFALTEK